MNTHIKPLISFALASAILALAPITNASGIRNLRPMTLVCLPVQVVVHKYCMHCNHEVSANSKVGQRCPFCHKTWGREVSTTKEKKGKTKTVSKTKNSPHADQAADSYNHGSSSDQDVAKQSGWTEKDVEHLRQIQARIYKEPGNYSHAVICEAWERVNLDSIVGPREFLPGWTAQLDLATSPVGVSPNLSPKVSTLTSMVPAESAITLSKMLPKDFLRSDPGIGQPVKLHFANESYADGIKPSLVLSKDLGWAHRHLFVDVKTNKVVEYSLYSLDAKTDKRKLFQAWIQHLTEVFGVPTQVDKDLHSLAYKWQWLEGEWKGSTAEIAFGTGPNGETCAALRIFCAPRD